jgi:hypothetical protein
MSRTLNDFKSTYSCIFSDKVIEELSSKYAKIKAKKNDLIITFTETNFQNNAKIYATQGFGRRLKTIVRCIDNVFRMLPPEMTKIPTEEDKTDATINIQAFIFNMFGAIDNLAWIFVEHKNIKRKNGEPLSNSMVGLIYKEDDDKKDKYKIIRDRSSVALNQYLTDLEKWFSNLASFRHALAHKIPLYIPRSVLESKAEEWNELEQKRDILDIAEWRRINAQQIKLQKHDPCIINSIEGQLEKNPIRKLMVN